MWIRGGRRTTGGGDDVQVSTRSFLYISGFIIFVFRSGVGTSGSIQTMYYLEVTDDDKSATGGGGTDDEMIDVIEYSLDEARDMVKQGSNNTSPPSCLLGIMWFLANRVPVTKCNL